MKKLLAAVMAMALSGTMGYADEGVKENVKDAAAAAGRGVKKVSKATVKGAGKAGKVAVKGVKNAFKWTKEKTYDKAAQSDN